LQQRKRGSGPRPEPSPLLHPAASPEVLMGAYQSGDAAAATALIHRVSPLLHRLFAADAASRSYADDLLQETWLRIHRVRHTYRPGELVLPWAYAIARHVRIDHYRRMRRTTGREENLEHSDQSAAVPSSYEPGALEELAVLLAPLSAGQREVIEMLKIAGMSLEEVARATSSSVGSVKQKAHRAYRRLRSHWRELQTGRPDSGRPL
jgi:RNA polymerase sigma-70 factor (ECF subfamily)